MATHKRPADNNRRKATKPLSEKADEVRRSVRELGTAALDAAEQAAAQFRDKAAERAGEYRDAAAEQAGEYYSQGRERALDLEHTLAERIRERPLESALIAVGVGILIGVLWTRR